MSAVNPEIHTATHPGKVRAARLPAAETPAEPAPSAEDILAALAAEAAEEDADADP